MRLVKAPRATWQTCGHQLTCAIGVTFIALALVLGIVAVWTVSDKVGMTAMLIGISGIVTAITGLLAEAETRCYQATIVVPLPWRRRVEDES